jgi:uncharacterized protein YggU (UPF0235/DUF167 family)
METYFVKVKTSCRKIKVDQNNENLLIELTEKPINNRANEQLLKVLKNHFRVDNIKIVEGVSDNKKVVLVNRNLEKKTK